MDVDAFEQRLPKAYGGDLYADHPLDRRFRDLMADVEGMSSENKLALLNLAGSLLPTDEVYLEVGTYKGLSIIAAMLGTEEGSFVSIENFHGFGMHRLESRQALEENLRRWGVRDRLILLKGDCFRLLREGAVPGPVGVYFYDGNHSRVAQYLALGVVEPWLADRALVIIDDASWPVVAEPTDRYVRTHRGYRLLVELEAAGDRDPKWWDGLRVYAYDRPPRVARSTDHDLAWRRLAYSIYEPALYLVGKAVLGSPRMTRLAKRMLRMPSHQVCSHNSLSGE